MGSMLAVMIMIIRSLEGGCLEPTWGRILWVRGCSVQQRRELCPPERVWVLTEPSQVLPLSQQLAEQGVWKGQVRTLSWGQPLPGSGGILGPGGTQDARLLKQEGVWLSSPWAPASPAEACREPAHLHSPREPAGRGAAGSACLCTGSPSMCVPVGGYRAFHFSKWHQAATCSTQLAEHLRGCLHLTKQLAFSGQLQSTGIENFGNVAP